MKIDRLVTPRVLVNYQIDAYILDVDRMMSVVSGVLVRDGALQPYRFPTLDAAIKHKQRLPVTDNGGWAIESWDEHFSSDDYQKRKAADDAALCKKDPMYCRTSMDEVPNLFDIPPGQVSRVAVFTIPTSDPGISLRIRTLVSFNENGHITAWEEDSRTILVEPPKAV